MTWGYVPKSRVESPAPSDTVRGFLVDVRVSLGVVGSRSQKSVRVGMCCESVVTGIESQEGNE